MFLQEEARQHHNELECCQNHHPPIRHRSHHPLQTLRTEDHYWLQDLLLSERLHYPIVLPLLASVNRLTLLIPALANLHLQPKY